MPALSVLTSEAFTSSNSITFSLGKYSDDKILIRQGKFCGKKFSGKVGEVKKDYGVNLDSVVSKNEEIDDTDLDGETVMMNLDKGQYFMMNEVGSRIWELIEGNTSIVNIIETLTNEYEVDEETCENTVMEFLGRLKNADLIKVV